MKECDVDMLLARAQVWFAMMLLTSIVGLVYTLILFHTQLSETGTTIVTSVIAALITILTLQMNFFYARTRPAAIPDPATTTTETKITTTPAPTIVPVGSTLVHAPVPPAAIIPLAQPPETPAK